MGSMHGANALAEALVFQHANRHTASLLCFPVFNGDPPARKLGFPQPNKPLLMRLILGGKNIIPVTHTCGVKNKRIGWVPGFKLWG